MRFACTAREVAALSKADALLAKYKSQPRARVTAETRGKASQSKTKSAALR